MEAAKLLSQLGADPNYKSKSAAGRTPLIWAIYDGNLDLVKFLLDVGADPDLPAEEGRTPLGECLMTQEYKKETKFHQIETLLRSHGAKNVKK